MLPIDWSDSLPSYVGALAFGYLLGSIPFGLLLTRLAGAPDIRCVGSGNIGATNVLRTGRKGLAAATLLCDILKGTAAVLLAYTLAGRQLALVAGLGAFLGHLFPVWLRFKGGKGVATSAGSLAGVTPISAFTIFLVWLVVYKVTRYVSLASIVAASALPVIVGILVVMKQTQGAVLFYFSLGMTALVVWRHRSNISRLLNGTEPRFARK